MSQSLTFQSHSVRIHVENEQPWFVAKDVCKALGITWKAGAGNSGSLAAIPETWQGMGKLPTPRGGGSQKLRVISEPAVYKLAFRSNKPEADAFTNWVASEVLPAIRKTGKYEAAPIRECHALPAAQRTEVDAALYDLETHARAAFAAQERLYALCFRILSPAIARHHTTQGDGAYLRLRTTEHLLSGLNAMLDAVGTHAKELTAQSGLRL